jgi:hypothetical protein
MHILFRDPKGKILLSSRNFVDHQNRKAAVSLPLNMNDTAEENNYRSEETRSVQFS